MSRNLSHTLLALLLMPSLILAGFLPFSSSVVFDDFDDNVTDSTKWIAYTIGDGPTVSEVNNQLEITFTAESKEPTGTSFFGAGYMSTCQLRGDFDLQVDYLLLNWPSGNGVRVGLTLDNDQERPPESGVSRVSFGDSTNDFPGYPREVYLVGISDKTHGVTETTHLSGKLRLSRSGNILTGYFLDGSSWVPLHTDSITKTDLYFEISAWSHNHAFIDKNVKLAFDNLIVNQGEIVCPQNDEPQFPMYLPLVLDQKPPPTGKIGYATLQGHPSEVEIYVFNADGTGLTKLSPPPLVEREYVQDYEPAWSPDGTKIAFVSSFRRPESFTTGLFYQRIYIMNANGTGLTELTQQYELTQKYTDEFYPTWSPDGAKIVFTSWAQPISKLSVINADGTGLVSLAEFLNYSSGPDYESPQWSPDGTKIAFVKVGPAYEVYVVNADGTGYTNLTKSAGRDHAPVWSPDGTKIAFVSTRDGNSEIYVMNADGTGQTNLTNYSGEDLGPVWSPDGTKIAYVSVRGSVQTRNQEIYVMNADGTDQKNLTNSLGNDNQPVWSLDGTRIAYSHSYEATISIMNMDGTNVIRFVDYPMVFSSLQWVP